MPAHIQPTLGINLGYIVRALACHLDQAKARAGFDCIFPAFLKEQTRYSVKDESMIANAASNSSEHAAM